MNPFDEGDLDEGIDLTPDELLTVRVFGRVLLAYGEDVEGELAPTPNGYPIYSTRFRFDHLQREYSATILNFDTDLRFAVTTEEWKAALWIDPPSPPCRSLTDIFGRKIREHYRPQNFPLFDNVADQLKDCRGGKTEADDVILAFWNLTYGRKARGRGRKCSFHGDKEIFERDMLVLKMDQQYADRCERLKLL